MKVPKLDIASLKAAAWSGRQRRSLLPQRAVGHQVIKRGAILLLAALMALAPAAPLLAQSSELFIPLVGEGSAPESTGFALGKPLVKGQPHNSYIVVLEASPAVAYQGEVAGLAATAPTAGEKLDVSTAAVQAYVDYLVQGQDSVMAAAGVDAADKLHSYTYALNGFAAKLTPAQVDALTQLPGVVTVLRDQFRFKQEDDVPAYLGLTAEGGAWSQLYTGEGVVVGVIDSGIWPEHPSFADDGSYGPSPLPVAPPCQFGNTAHNPDDAPFTCNNKLLGARVVLDTYRAFTGLGPDEFDSARDDDGHGTHTASTAAGNANVVASIFGIPRGRVSGVAPRARVIAYKGLGELGGYTSDLVEAIDLAVADGVDVINYSVGGGASLTGGDEIAYLFAADAGVFVATSAGNSGPDDATMGGPASAPWLTAVGASFPNRLYISDIYVSGPGRAPRFLWGGSITPGISNYRLVDAEGIADETGDTSGECLNPFPAGTFQANDAVFCNRYDFGVGRTTRVTNVKVGGGGAVIFHNVPEVNVTPTDNHPLPTVHMLYTVGVPLKQYLNRANGPIRISFTTGQARYAFWDWRVTPNVMTSFSSRGPNPVAPDIIKPDVTAPGYQILAGASPDHINTAAQGQLFQSIMGTSMSSPQVAGLFALIKQVHPDWTPAMARSALMTTAHQRVFESNFHTPADPFDMGAGHVNGTLLPLRSTMFMPGLVYDADIFDYFGFLCTAAPEVLVDPEGFCADLVASGIPTDPSDLNLPSIGVAELPGSQTITRRFMSVAPDNAQRTYRVEVDAPPGYSVSVNPDQISLRNGEVASYEVTIVNNSAPIGEWRFGSLTWRDRNLGRDYTVYSPIAVRGTLFDAPAEIEGEGADGSASFEIKFGYNGDYTAAPHGLVAANVIADTVDQDPDQLFDPADGFSNIHEIDVSGAAHLRIAIPPEATEDLADLDIYLVDPTGELVAASFNAGTDEQIDIPLPEDGTWELYVHGWQTVGPDSDYDAYVWLVPLASGGSLVIDNAPTSVTSGDVAQIDISWTGATDGWYMGAVSHSDADGLLGLTLVNVDNRPAPPEVPAE